MMSTNWWKSNVWLTFQKKDIILNFVVGKKELESVMCDVIKIRIKRRIVTRSGKGNQPLNIKQL